jgi:PAS domain S-box-containing protein
VAVQTPAAKSQGEPALSLDDVFAVAVPLARGRLGTGVSLLRTSAGARSFAVGEETWSLQGSVDPAALEAFVAELRRLHAPESSPDLRTIVDNLPVLVCIADSAGRYRWVNRSAEAILGRSPDSLLDRPLAELVHPDDLSATLQIVAEHAEGFGADGFENRYVRPDGATVWLRWTSSVMPDGHIAACALPFTAAVEQRQRQEQLEEIRDAAAHLGKVGAYYVDLTADQTWWSDEVKRILEVPLDFVPSYDAGLEFYAPEARPLVLAAIRQAARSDRPLDFEAPVITATGRRRIVKAFGRAVRDESGRAIGLRGGFQDITERWQREEAIRDAVRRAEEASRAKSDFMAAMSHEIRNPVNGLLGVLELLTATGLSDEQRRLVRLMQRSGEVLTNLLKRVLQLGRLESGEFVLTSEPLDLAQLARDSLEVLAPTRPDLEVTVSGPPHLELQGDRGRLRQIIDNLVGNALKYTESGSVRVVIEGDARGQRIVVADTGPGIAEDQLTLIFERFKRIDPGSHRRRGGTGLGLAIARQLAREMGGDITVESAPGRGSTFTLALALAPAESGSSEAQPAGHPTSVIPPGSRVLVVDDDPVSRFVAQSILADWGVQVDLACDGREALVKVETRPPDLVLMDCIMPELDGWDATVALRARGFRRPIIALSGSSTQVDVTRAFASGMDDHITKPIHPKELRGALAHWLAVRDSQTPTRSD